MTATPNSGNKKIPTPRTDALNAKLRPYVDGASLDIFDQVMRDMAQLERENAHQTRRASMAIINAHKKYEKRLRAERERLASGISEASQPDPADFQVLLVNEGGEEEVAAETSGPRERALADARHYALQYVQDGPVKIVELIRRDVETLTPRGTK